MDKNIPFLVPRDKIKIVSPAKGIEPSLVFEAKEYWEKQGFIVELGQFCIGKHHYFSGTDQERTSDFQDALDNPEIKAIICARGGYGSIRIVDLINWSSFIRNPKWIVGFSDITVFHQRLQHFGYPSIHATMPLNYKQNSKESLKTLVDSLTGKLKEIKVKSHSKNILGKTKGILLGGNFSIVYSTLGTSDQPDYTGAVLFLEDLAEQLYHIDRMFYALQKSGIMNHISALIIGGFTDMQDTKLGFGKDLEGIIQDHISYRNIPLVFDFPAGHIDDNRAMIFGKEVELNVQKDETTLSF